MALKIDFNAIQDCDCSSYKLTDLTNYTDYPQNLFSDREITITYADGKQDVIDWPFSVPFLTILNSKDFAAVITLELTPISPVSGEEYSRDKNIVITCRADNRAANLGKTLPDKECDRSSTILAINELDAGIESAKRLTRMGFISKAQDVLDYINSSYKHCNCGCS